MTAAMMMQTVNYYIITKDSAWVEVREISLKDAKKKVLNIAPKYFACFAFEIN